MRQQTTRDERGQFSANAAVVLVIGLAVAGLVTAVLAPVALDAITQDNDVSFTDVTEGETVEVIPGSLNATLDNVDDTNGTITVTLTDVESGNTVTADKVSTSKEVTLEGETLTVTLDAIDSATQADFTVSHPPEYAWSGAAKSLWGILDLVIVLAIFLLLIGMALVKNNGL